MAYLGDLWAHLPESEQDYWKSFNVLTDERMNTYNSHDYFSVSFVDKVLKNHTYSGMIVYGKSKTESSDNKQKSQKNKYP